MQQAPHIAFSFLQTQTCTNCQLPVTCGPVYVVNDLSILCGRCCMIAKDQYRNYAYEALASTFLYPCKNWCNHCPVRLPWNDSLDHENECNYTGCCTFLCTHPGAFFKGKRDIPHDEVRLTFVPENLLEYLECVMCRSYLNSFPVFIQSNGQNICHRCIYANGNPPNCRRNHAYENFSQIFLFPCNNRNRGCKERLQYGRSVWKHESQCDFAPNVKSNLSELIRNSLRSQTGLKQIGLQPRFNNQQQQQPSQDNPRNSITPSEQQRSSIRPKERGIIETHRGPIWATINPNKAVVDKQLLKSLAKKQGRQIRRADEIGNEMGRRNSESESVSTNESYSLKTSGASTPDILDYSRRPYIPPEDYNDSRPASRESGYQTAQRYPEYSYGLKPNESFRESPGPGQYPVLKPHQLSDGLDSIKRISHRESARGNTLLINELKIKQDIIKRTHSIKGDKDLNSPYKQCNNLDDIIEVNRRLR